MDYPFVKQTSAGYIDHVQSLSTKESQKQVSANTVRILLLEEQNSELREKSVVELRDSRTASATQVSVIMSVKLYLVDYYNILLVYKSIGVDAHTGTYVYL